MAVCCNVGTERALSGQSSQLFNVAVSGIQSDNCGPESDVGMLALLYESAVPAVCQLISRCILNCELFVLKAECEASWK
jgi:hypothetical protein